MPAETRATAYVNGRIFTLDSDHPWAEALLVRDGRFLAVGSREQILSSGSETMDIIDLDGAMVMPSIHDAHTHLLSSGLKFKFECRLRPNANDTEIVDDLCECVNCSRAKLGNWIVGGEFNPNVFDADRLDRKFLDEAFPDTPVYLYDYTIHHAFVNSKALELAGVDETTPDPRGGKIVRRPGTLEPTGELVERATWKVRRAVTPYAPDVYREAMVWAIKTSNKFGITSVQEASASLPELEVLKEMDERGELTMRVAAHLVWQEESFGGGVSCEDQEKLIGMRQNYESSHVRTNFVKCWLDGAPLPPHFTESRLDPETGEPDYSNIQISEDDLAAALISFDRQGLTLKIHCAGEGSIRVALNAIARMREENGSDGQSHEIAHCTFIHADDRKRFAELQVVAEMSPAIWHIKSPEFAVLDAGYKFRTMKDMNAHLTIGSDWIITEDPNLFPALQGMLERGEESVDLASALHMMTLAGAEAVGLSHETGSITVGKSADFIVLDRNLFEVPTNMVGDTRVLQTIFEGKVIYEA